MPVLIQELVITTILNANNGQSVKPVTVADKAVGTADRKELVRHCVEQVLAILQEKQER